MLGKSTLVTFIKKNKLSIKLSAINALEDERELDDEETKERSEKEEVKENHSFHIESNFPPIILNSYNCNKHLLNFYKIQFKSYFEEVATPPPELV